MEMPKINALFKPPKYNRFLMHLIAHHNLVGNYNSMRIRSIVRHEELCCKAGLMLHYLKHSCAPNIVYADRDGHIVMHTIRPINKGEQLTTLYFGILRESKETRQRIIWQEREFVCKCERCENEPATVAQRQQIFSDANYQAIVARAEDDFSQPLMDKCETVLRMFGRIPWCDELGMVVETYTLFVRARLTGPIKLNMLREIMLENLNL